jgi:hypothetical protein
MRGLLNGSAAMPISSFLYFASPIDEVTLPEAVAESLLLVQRKPHIMS